MFFESVNEINAIKDVIVPLVSSLVGAGIGAYVAFRVSRRTLERTFSDALTLDARRSRADVRGYLLGMRAEIGALLDLYKSEFVEEVLALEPGKSFPYTYPITGNYFVVFEAGAASLGQIPDDDFRRVVITLYTAGRRLIETHIYITTNFWRM